MSLFCCLSFHLLFQEVVENIRLDRLGHWRSQFQCKLLLDGAICSVTSTIAANMELDLQLLLIAIITYTIATSSPAVALAILILVSLSRHADQMLKSPAGVG